MRKLIIIISAILLASVTAQAVKVKDLKIYINPGHGGYESDDRNIRIYPFAGGDTLGYWESKSNLYKGLHMYHILDSIGAKAYLSRIKNGPDDDRSLSGISREANDLGCDLFFSIHTNAGETVNYPLMLYRENAVGTPRYPEAITLSNILWDNLHSSKLSLWTRDNRYVSGDLTFYPQWGSSGLGVLRNLYVVGLLSEGGMHEHRPEAHRLMSDDFLWLEAWHFVKTIMDFYNTEDRFVTGNVAGVIYDDNNTREDTLEPQYSAYGRDKNKPINGAYIELRNKAGEVVQKRTTDNMNNGVFVFRNVAPGTYDIVVNKEGYYEHRDEVVVKADEVTYNDVAFSMKRDTPLVVETYSPNVADGELVSCVEPIIFRFNYDISAESFKQALKIEPAVEGEITFSESYHVAQFKPLYAFDLSTHYNITLGTELKTPDPYYEGSHLSKALNFDFTTKGRNKLEMIKSFPDEGGQVHYSNANLEFRFDKKLAAAGIFNLITVKDNNGNKVPINTRQSQYNKLSGDFGNVIISLNSDLTIGEKYTVELSADIKDNEGIPLSEKTIINFTANNQGLAKEGNIIEDFQSAEVLKYNAEESKKLTKDATIYLMTSKYLFDGASVKFNYSFSDMKGGELVADYVGDMKIVHNGDKIGLHVFGDLNDHELYLGFAAGTDTKYTKICNLNFVGWHYYEVTLDNLEKDVDYLFSNVKLIQSEGLYAQQGGFQLDNMLQTSGAGIGIVEFENVKVDYNLNTRLLTVGGADDIAKVEIYNIQGSMMISKSERIIDCTSLVRGIYLVKVYLNDSYIVKTIAVN
ncbi:MAG: Ig-like domain-containing protein [Muribaculaceae bacterium]|nr:Ig-like domain-containing protein [Muribaculaceae bacterium]